jgi:hypothetical protein
VRHPPGRAELPVRHHQGRIVDVQPEQLAEWTDPRRALIVGWRLCKVPQQRQQPRDIGCGRCGGGDLPGTWLTGAWLSGARLRGAGLSGV